ncbi:hypothetical protein SpAn4DRAFT_3107 [Sporomusa ovata]|uniref:Uncharacterized protein n=1 Tax=Sporomusa ovata TaxID=2378 RepID=A0A0U1KZ07_9FIRM|nr:hypothetical protein SpAn4DRAFT_3107 [Sporomusa ovata]
MDTQDIWFGKALAENLVAVVKIPALVRIVAAVVVRQKRFCGSFLRIIAPTIA